MRTQNYINTLISALGGCDYAGSIVDYNGETKDIFFPSGSNYADRYARFGLPVGAAEKSSVPVLTSLKTDSGIILGTGTTPPALSDYRLSGEMITTVSATATTKTGVDESGAYRNVTLIVTNTGDSEITVGEVGYMGHFPRSSDYRLCLMDRVVLDTPVTIPAGGVGQVIYSIRTNFPTA